MKEKIRQIVDLIDRAKRIVVTSHKDPDGDSIGSQLALAKLLSYKKKEFKILNQGDLSSKYRFLDQEKRIETCPPKEDFGADLVIVLECSNLDRIGWVKDMINPKAEIINIDHHPDNTSFGKINYLDHQASAVGEMIYNIFQYLNCPIDQETATLLYATILTDTGRFRFVNTTPRCLEVCANLIKFGADPRLITDQIYFSSDKNYMKLLGYLLINMELFEDGQICFFSLNRKVMEKYGVAPWETEGLVNHTLFTKGVAVGALLIESEDDRVRVGLRSQNDFDVSKLAKSFEGGGHKNAAGCIITENLNKAKQLLLEQIKKEQKRELGGVVISK